MTGRLSDIKPFALWTALWISRSTMAIPAMAPVDSLPESIELPSALSSPADASLAEDVLSVMVVEVTVMSLVFGGTLTRFRLK